MTTICEAIPTTLAAYRPGQHVRVESVNTDPRFSSRLSALGVLPGLTLEIVRVAPMGDPITIRFNGQEVALRRTHAKALHVSPLSL